MTLTLSPLGCAPDQPGNRRTFSFDITTRLDDSVQGLGRGGKRHGRTGVIHTPHGDIRTPAFVPVATQSAMKGVLPEQMKELGAQCLLSNAFHLFERPGEDVLDEAGGLAQFMNWDGPTYTDSGGFQVLSLGAGFKKTLAMDVKGMKSDDVIADGKERMAFVDEDGVTFKSPLNGSLHRFSAEISMGIQHKIGADIMFAFDELTTLMNTRSYQEQSVDRTFRWAQRCVSEHQKLTASRVGKPYQALFGVVQGANYEDLRRLAASQIASLDFDGVGIGGAIEKQLLGQTCAWICDEMPESRPRHVLGIAAVNDIFNAVENGGDTFDCVAPARNGRNGAIFTRDGRWNVKRAQFKRDFRPLEDGCDCYTCRNYSRAYVDHLLRAREFNGFTLATIHNEHFFVKLLDDIRASIDGGYFDEFKQETLARFYANGSRG
ncbi:tRNA guanosine(34) transglycosylase Tgt [Bifidobacterium crudilactis]|jgi:queuine tRNA-ribosyltransferase|uniref:Queuine tRNA-ribosyltransferase n=1 Tax=Bifidobacterium crudilactis TaxID=327277 RepID=A0A971CZH4_9BIFI|nr:tRNA guanosine(34) transglycosylase Tgt [Bifidobacterium crudilactis]MCI1868766.1 tRNA guanosine(34) transglycosylase Tgt [Bifidobacterium crudilactis]MDN5972874.1 tRNA guanosine(34) transglycosylase Tgt [Bifidobacterium crudilactis]MDN6000726.1 tRNA guanosine(34) transglycosylase Tgt [Bifidobacterium crudilactis]MDN6208822.1 tRNA guanosine(34) transglycosylase Tgt [Bifidobacterium crudilactis]MDN6234828.1 tRNA guanosine(34) transglycosylase Tgt [Bifidobacterium crudilactis]